MPDIRSSGVQHVGHQAAELRRAGGELEASITQLDDRDRGEEGALPGRVGLDVAFLQRGGRPGRRAAARRGARSGSCASRRTGRSPGGRTGRGRGGERRASRGRIVGERRRRPFSGLARDVAGYDEIRAPVAQWTERGRPKACVGGSSPSGGATVTATRSRRTAPPVRSAMPPSARHRPAVVPREVRAADGGAGRLTCSKRS